MQAVNMQVNEIINRINALSGSRTLYLSSETESDNAIVHHLTSREILDDETHGNLIAKIIDHLLFLY